MPVALFEALCVAVVVLTLAAMARTRPWRDLLAAYAGLAVAGWIGEQTCVAWYDFYHYAPAWHGRLGQVPLLVPLIWPLVILSARDVAAALGARSALVVGAIVAFDASLVEVVAVRAGLWSWVEPGHLGVPIIGMLGWGCFAFGASLDVGPRWARPFVGVVVAHALILATWWGGLRWIARGDLGVASMVGIAVVAAAALGGVIAARARGGGIPLGVALPRMIAATLFVALLVATAPSSVPLWTHAALVAVPYLAATRFTASGRSPEAPRAARAGSRR